MTFEFCSSGSCIRLAGKGANAKIIVSGAYLDERYNQNAGAIGLITRQDLSGTSGAIKAAYRGAVGNAIAKSIAMDLINFDMAGYTTRAEAQTQLDILRDDLTRTMEALDKHKDLLS